MQDIQLKFIDGIDNPSINKGANVPNWYGNESDRSSWYSSPNPFDYWYWYNLLSGTTNTTYIQYGQNKQGWGSGRFFAQDVQIVEQTHLENGSIRVKVRSRLIRFRQRKTDFSVAGFNVRYNLKILGNTVFSYSGTTIDNINEGASDWYERTYTVAPLETEQGTGINLEIKYPNGDAIDNDMFIGFGLYNPNPPTYVPMAIRKNGSWKDLDSNKGKIKRRINNTWVDKSEENFNTSKEINKGKNRIRRSGNWRQLPKMKGGNAT